MSVADPKRALTAILRLVRLVRLSETQRRITNEAEDTYLRSRSRIGSMTNCYIASGGIHSVGARKRPHSGATSAPEPEGSLTIAGCRSTVAEDRVYRPEKLTASHGDMCRELSALHDAT
jgi:hypothetical protein